MNVLGNTTATRANANARAQDKHDERKAQVWRALRAAYIAAGHPATSAESLATAGAKAVGPLL